MKENLIGGKLRGRLSEGPIVEDGIKSETCREFLGIPYVAPPVGPLRWKSPQPHPGWTGSNKEMNTEFIINNNLN